MKMSNQTKLYVRICHIKHVSLWQTLERGYFGGVSDCGWQLVPFSWNFRGESFLTEFCYDGTRYGEAQPGRVEITVVVSAVHG